MHRWKPALPKRWLIALAGLLWMIAGSILCFRGGIWLDGFARWQGVLLEAGGLLIGGAGYAVRFHRLVRKNVDRITRLPDRPCAFAFTSWTGYVMIVSMMTLGMTLRHSSLPLWWLSVPYTAMGTALLAGSLGFFRAFRTERANAQD